jgi:LacI family transcriptional regulator
MRAIPQVAILIETSRAYGRGLLEGVARYVREHGPWSIYFRPHGLGDPPPAWLRSWRGHGILARIDDRRLARAARATGVPVIDLRGRLPDLGLPRVGIDNHTLARLAFDHLRERGLRHFAFCGLRRGEHRHMDWRRDDFVKLVQAAAMTCAVYEPPGRRPLSWEQEQQAMASWLAAVPKPVGVMACNDDWGQQVLDACLRGNMPVPDAVAVISVENDPIVCSLATPPLTSIDVNPQRVGYEAAALLERLMAGQPAPADGIYLDLGRVVTRQSTDVLAIDDAELARAVRFIRTHACDGINVEDVLAATCLSRSVLERRFKQMLGRTPKAEILTVQIERARQLLAETDLALDAVARQAGFRGEKYFGDIFHRKVGVRAGAYRRQVRLRGDH